MVYGTLRIVSCLRARHILLDRYILLEKNRTKAAVERHWAFGLHDLSETTNEAIGKGWLRHQPDTCSLEGAKGNVGEELGGGGGREVDGGAVVRGGLVAESVDALLLEEFITTKFKGTLEEVSSKGWADAGPYGGGSLLGDDFAEAADQAGVVLDGIELDASLDPVADDGSAMRSKSKSRRVGRGSTAWERRLHLHVNWRETAVGERTADGAGEGES